MRGVRGVLMLGLSAAAGLAAVALVDSKPTTTVATAENFPMVVVVKEDVAMGSMLDATMLKAVAWPSGLTPSGAFESSETLIGRVVTATLQRGEPVLDPKLAPVGSKGGLSAMIAAGNRAITVKVNEVVGVAGFALPGNFVDVLVSTEDNGKRPISKIVLERILVLAIAQNTRGRGDNAPKVVDAVTLQVSPEQAERLDLARSVGALSLVLRNQVDEIQAATRGARKHDLFGKTVGVNVKRSTKRRKVAAAKPQAPVVEVIRGTQRANKTL